MGRKKKRKTNTLGLTPGMESETEDDEGEEEALVKLLGQEKFQYVFCIFFFWITTSQLSNLGAEWMMLPNLLLSESEITPPKLAERPRRPPRLHRKMKKRGHR